MRRVERERLHECAFRLLAITRLPRRQAEHVEPPCVVGPALGVGLEEDGGIIVAAPAIGGIRQLERDRTADDERRLPSADGDRCRRRRSHGLTGTSLVGVAVAAGGKGVGGDHRAHDPSHENDRESQRTIGLIQLELIRHGSSGSRGSPGGKADLGPFAKWLNYNAVVRRLCLDEHARRP